jgi:YD repeat-containing protein
MNSSTTVTDITLPNNTIVNSYNSNGNLVTSTKCDGYWEEKTYDDRGNVLTHKDSTGYWDESTYNEKGNRLTYKDSTGYSKTYIY